MLSIPLGGGGSLASELRNNSHFQLGVHRPGSRKLATPFDYQGAHIVVLDSMRDKEAQIPWLCTVLEKNPHPWTIVTFHHPLFSPARDRDNPELRALWKPVLDEFKVDLVLTGHDHTYARAGRLSERKLGDIAGVPPYDPEIGTVYVVSVSGTKMYDITNENFVRTTEDTQLYQVVRVDHDKLHFEARPRRSTLRRIYVEEARRRPAERIAGTAPGPEPLLPRGGRKL